ncbi:MAG: DUF2752 domain-containing protein [Lachnospiraceae bacterium]|nr:DUF2752 domain-containing protein [Lachnospiraceae bacterium]
MKVLKSNNKKEITIEAVLFGIGVIGLIILVALMLLDRCFPVQMGRIKLPCFFNVITGYYCPGCGGTRAFKALMHGNIIKSFTSNAMVLYIVVIYVWFMGSHLLSRITKGKIKGLKYRHIYLWLALIIMIVNCLVHNFLLYKYGWGI